MNRSRYQQDLVDTAACTKIIMEATKGVGHKYRKGVMRDCFIFCSWFSSKKSAEAAMEVGDKFIGMVKTNTKGFLKVIIDNLTNDWKGGSYLVLRINPMVPRVRPFISIGCKYNSQKVIFFVI